jgi:CIC family chloride channel protein
MRKFPLRLHTLMVNLDGRVQSIIIAMIVGSVSGLAAVILNRSLKGMSDFVDRSFQGWMLVAAPLIGIMLTVVWLKYLVRDFGGHGVPEVIYSVGMKGGRLRLRSAYSRLVGSLLTLAGGGSAGPEAPVVISGAAIGSNIASYFRTNDRIRTAVTGSGAAAAIAAIFNAPLAGIIFTMEVILGEWTALNLLPVAIASVSGTIVSRALNGNQIPFSHRPLQIGLTDILAAAGLAVLAALCAVALIRVLRWAGVLFAKLTSSDLGRALAGGLMVGGLAYFFVEVRGDGYDVVRTLIEGRFEKAAGLAVALVALKVAATALTLSAGGAGGVFAPSLVIGSLTGFFYHQILTAVFPAVTFAGPGLFALVGMAGVLSGTLQAPLTAMFLILEITSGYDAILPLLIVSFLAATLVKLAEKNSIYVQELVRKGMLVRPRTDAHILSDLRVDELLEKDCTRIRPDMTLEQMVPVIQKSRRNYFPVEDRESGKFLGMVTFDDIKPYLFTQNLLPTIIVEEVMRTDLLLVDRKDRVVDILKKFDMSESWSLPVVEEDRFVGLISKATLLDHYRKELLAQTDL